MAYLVDIAARAQRDLASLYEEIDAGDSEAALKWYRGLKEAVLSLEKLPNRCPPTSENPQLRHLLYGRKPHVYRVIYRVLESEKRVEVLHIRHGARRRFGAADLRQDDPKPTRPA
jgi:plasmid stabilization system protein ParE